MDFKKKFDYDDINNFLPDNKTIGKSDYFQSKFGDKMPEYICEILEISSREEYTSEEENKKLIKKILDAQLQYSDNLIKEFEERNQKSSTSNQSEFTPCKNLALDDFSKEEAKVINTFCTTEQH
jgi:hypothetical protein